MSRPVIKLDEDLSPLLAEPLERRGFEVRTVQGQGWGGFPDERLWPLLDAEGVLLITADTGFGDARKFHPSASSGILVLRPRRESVPLYVQLLKQVLTTATPEQLLGRLAVASPKGLRFAEGKP